MKFSTGGSGSYKVSIDAGGRLSLGGLDASTYYPTYNQFVMGSTTGSAGMTIVSKNDSSGYITWADGTSSADQYRGRLFYSHTDNSFKFRANGLVNDILKIDSAQVYINSTATDGVLNLDTTSGNGTFIRFKQSNTSKCWVGCAEGLGGGDQDDLGLRATDKIIFFKGSTARAYFHSNGHFIPWGNNSYNLGTTGDRRKTIYSNKRQNTSEKK